MNYRNTYEYWKSIPSLTDEQKKELNSVASDEKELESRFSSLLSFGTAGLRGKMKLGTNAMNVFTVGMATEGIARYIKSITDKEVSVAIAHDSRNNSRLFAEKAASVLAYYGIHVYIFDELRPTPELSFALRHYSCIAGINITASHNPKEYNGYKAYWEDGAQIGPEQAENIAGFMAKADVHDIKSIDYAEGISRGIITVIGSEADEAYLASVLAQSIDRDVISKVADELNIVYSPLHGAGWKLVPEIISRIGIKHFHVVPEQAKPNGDFPTTLKPNPEYPEVFRLGIDLADKVNSDLIIATDPDADRVGIMVRCKDGHFVTLNGNQTGSLLLDYIISSYKRNNIMPNEPYAVKSIVTTELMSKICKEGNVELYNVLTGFKYIGEVIKKHEALGSGSFIFGAEESYGYLKGTYARDKDAVVATMLICEMTAYYKLKNMTLKDALDRLYEKYGYSLEKTQEIILDDYSGAEQMKKIMSAWRSDSINAIGGNKIINISDYKKQVSFDLLTNKSCPTGLPSSDVLRFELDTHDVIIIRPSGTEPKVKIYYLLNAEDEASAAKKLEAYMADVKRINGDI